MRNNDYHFVTTWRVEGALEEVAELIAAADELPRWWPSVYLAVKELEAGDAKTGAGKVVDLYTKGWLPYTLRWQFRVTESNFPHGFALEAWGDFVGHGIWTLEQDGRWVNVTYDWKVRADKALLRRFSALLKPVFSMNHEWAMRKGEESLRLELARRRAIAEEREQIPPPPAPTFRFPGRGRI